MPGKSSVMMVAGLAMMATTAMVGGATAQDVPPEFVINQSGWEGGARARSEAGEFSHCDVRRIFDGQRMLIVSLNRRNEINIGLVDPNFEFTPQTGTSAVVMQIDSDISARIPAAPGGDTILVLAAGQSDELIEALRRGNVMALQTEYGNFQFPLTGTFNAFAALRDCIRVANEILPPEPTLEELAANGPPGIGRAAMATLLQAAGIEGALIVPEDQLPDDEMELSQVWLIGDVVGGLHQSRRETATIEIDTFVEDYLEILGERCIGTFDAAPAETEIIDDRYAFTPVDMTCSGEGGTSAVAAIFVLDDNFYSVFFHEGDEELADQVSESTEALTALVRQLAVDSLEESSDSEGESETSGETGAEPDAATESEAEPEEEPAAEAEPADNAQTDATDAEPSAEPEAETSEPSGDESTDQDSEPASDTTN
ncbi:MAG: hypothetical protein AAF414_09895 [Pseudomonadota bacterium]